MARKDEEAGVFWGEDPIYEYVFRNKMQPYIDWAKKWWETWKDETYFETGTYPAKDGPPGLFVRFSRTLAHSPLYGVQAFPYVSVPYLHLHHMPGGVRRLVGGLVQQGITIDGFEIHEKRYLHGTDRNSQFLAIVPIGMMHVDEDVRGRYVWLNGSDIQSLAIGAIDKALQRRFTLMCKEGHGRPTLAQEDREGAE